MGNYKSKIETIKSEFGDTVAVINDTVYPIKLENASVARQVGQSFELPYDITTTSQQAFLDNNPHFEDYSPKLDY